MLLAAEVFIAGAIIWVVGGHDGFSVHAAGLHREQTGGKTFAPIDAGAAPHITIDDPDSRVVVTTSTDGKVHVTDASIENGFFWGDSTRAPLQVARTNDGVAISRAAGHGVRVQFFGFSQDRVEVALPAASVLDVTQCGGAEVTGLTGLVHVKSVDGRITATDVHTDNLTLASDDGRLTLDNVTASTLDATTHDGSIRAHGLQAGSGTLHTDDGGITLALGPGANVAVHARTNDGRVSLDGRRAARNDDDSSIADYQVGTGGGSLQVSTQDGSIHITTNGAQ